LTALLFAQADVVFLRALVYAGFVGVVLVLLALDLGVFHRKAHAVSMREALGWTSVWVGLAFLFSGVVYALYEHHAFGLGLDVPILGRPGQTQVVGGLEAWQLYVTGYVIEESLSLDNVFVMAVIFRSLAIPSMYQHRVLFWGILGALVMRGVMIVAGYELVTRFAWITYVFGGFLILTALKMAFVRHDATDPSAGLAVRIARRLFPLTDGLDGQRLTTRIGGRLHATPLLLALVLIELTDVVFAFDSIPAIFAITADPFLVFTSNVFAILGLRSLYFCLAAMVDGLRCLQAALIAVLLFVGAKMCLVHTAAKIPTGVSLVVVVGLLATGVVASLVARARDRVHEAKRGRGDRVVVRPDGPPRHPTR
jgi:tellurite resistance protein TerC